MNKLKSLLLEPRVLVRAGRPYMHKEICNILKLRSAVEKKKEGKEKRV